MLGDEGSAWWIAREALRAALAAREGRGRQTLLNAAICRSLGVENLDAAVARFHAPGAKDEIAAAASRLPQYLPRADPVFSEILTRAGAERASQALAALRQSGLTARPVPVFLLGGVLAHNRRVRASLIKALQARLPISVKPPCLRPVLGAAALSLSASGISLTSGILRRLRNYREPHTAAN
jgi:N-acetylglucosamine kinase-like BadF-type ATPase